MPGLFHPKETGKSFGRLIKNHELMRVGALFDFVIAFMFLSVQWNWIMEPVVIIPVIGWLFFLEGIIVFWFPHEVEVMAKNLRITNKPEVLTMSVLGLITSGVLAYLGLFVF